MLHIAIIYSFYTWYFSVTIHNKLLTHYHLDWNLDGFRFVTTYNAAMDTIVRVSTAFVHKFPFVKYLPV